MPSNTNQTASEFPGIPTPRADVNALLMTVNALKQTVEVLTGARGSGDNQAATAKQIAELQAQITKLQNS